MPDYISFSPTTKRIIDRFISVDPKIIEGRDNILEVSRQIVENITEYHIVDAGTVRLMTQAEKDAYEQEKSQAQIEVENKRIADLDDLLKTDLQGITLTRIDNAIDNIGSLLDAKSFLKKLCRYIIKFISAGR